MLSQFGIEASPAVTYVIAFAIIFALLTLFAVLLRRITGRRSTLSGQGGRTRQPRLGIVDVYDLDRQRQLILLRRDNVEHLLLVGGPNDVVVETNIVRVPGARLAPAANEATPERIEGPLEAPPPSRPVLEAPRPEPMPPAAPEPARPAEPARAARTAPPAQQGARSATATMPTLPLQDREPALKPDHVALAPASRGSDGAQSGSPGAPGHPAPMSPAPPSPPQLRPVPASPPVPRAPGPTAGERPAPPRREPPPAPGQAGPREIRGNDAAVMSDMAKQLEQALTRSHPPRPEPGPPAPPTPQEPPPQRRPEVRPPRIVGEPSPGAEQGRHGEPAARPARPASPLAEPPRPGPVPAPPAAAPAAQPPGSASDPFSVEEIEAEFARLLGRPTRGDKG